ncbi:MAG: hypothetical protein IKX36_08950 [Prevotella sp.]|nr:hypothetical protein [Prevotella sp.]
MKRIWMLMALILPSLAMFAQQQSVALSEQNPTATAQFNGMMNVFLSLDAPNVEGYSNVIIEVENLDDEQVLLFFAKEYSADGKKLKKELKKDDIILDKFFHDAIEPYEGLKKILRVEPQSKMRLPVVSIPNGEEMPVALPVYVGKFKDKKHKQVILMNEELFTLRIQAGKGGTSEYSKLKEQTQKLIQKVNSTTFCTHSSHKKQAAKDKQKLQKEIDKLVASLQKQRDKWAGSLQTHQNYQDLIDQLQAVEFKEGLCSKHSGRGSGDDDGIKPPPPPDPNANCAYRNLSAQQIKQQLDNYYVQIYNSANRSATKTKVIGAVKALYNCYNNHNHGRKKTNASDINKIYNKINSVK